MKFIYFLIFSIQLIKFGSNTSNYCSKFQISLFINNKFEDTSNPSYVFNATLEISSGSNRTTLVSIYDVSDTSSIVDSFDFWYSEAQNLIIGTTCTLNSNNQCSINLPSYTRNIIQNSPSSSINVNISVGENFANKISPQYYAVPVALPNFYQGYSLDKISDTDEIYGYSNFQSEKIGICKEFLTYALVFDQNETLILQDSGYMTPYYMDSSLFYNINVTESVATSNLFSNTASFTWLGCKTNATTLSQCSRNLTNINGTSPIFWFVDWLSTDTNGSTLYETVGALPLTMVCSDPNNNCSNAKDYQFYVYDQAISTTCPSYWANSTIYPLSSNMNAQVYIECKTWEASNTTTTTPINPTSISTTTMTSQCGSTIASTMKTVTSSSISHVTASPTPNGASYILKNNLITWQISLSFLFFTLMSE